MMNVTIVCPTYNEEKFLDNCVNSILSQDFPQERLEVLFVDGMSSDRTRDMLASYCLQHSFFRLLDNKKRIAPAALNIGIKAAKGEIIIRMDAHSTFPHNYVSVLVENLLALKADNVGGVCCTRPIDNSLTSRTIAIGLSCPFGVGNAMFRLGVQKITLTDTVPFGCYFKTLFDRVGYYDEELIRNQDDEFNGRVINNGGKIYLLPNLCIDYYPRDSYTKLYKMYYQYGLFKPLVNKKLGKPATIRQLFPAPFVLCLWGGLFLSPFSVIIQCLLLLMMVVYCAMAFYFSAKAAISHKSAALTFALPWVFFLLHYSYGWGYIVGLWKVLWKLPFNKVKPNR